MKWIKRFTLAAVVVTGLGVVTLYVWSSLIIDRKYPVKIRTATLSTDPAVIRDGERLAKVMGCFQGCHGDNMEGRVFFEQDFVGRFIAPNLTTAVNRYSLPELEAIIRQGVRPDGRGLLGMPSDGFSVMTDQDLTAILSFITSWPTQEGDLGQSEVGPLARLGLVSGEFWVPASRIRPEPWRAAALNDSMKNGEYLAILNCSECHGENLEGQENFTPSLAIARAYSREQFSRLLAAGVGLGDRDLGLMSTVATTRFSHLEAGEVNVLYDYLVSRESANGEVSVN